jgi:thiamine transport system ATP-binding protein
LPPGIAAVIGPSGGGKSTLLDLVSGFLLPDTGTIRVGRRDITQAAPGERPVATLFQDNNLFPHMTALRNVVLGLTTAIHPDKSSLNQAKAALAEVGLTRMEHRFPADLSGGQRARVALARAILSQRPVVCLDEPFSALGPALRRDMLDLVAEKLADRTVLMVTHEPDDALRIAPMTIFVAGGLAQPAAETQSLFENPPPALATYLG